MCLDDFTLLNLYKAAILNSSVKEPMRMFGRQKCPWFLAKFKGGLFQIPTYRIIRIAFCPTSTINNPQNEYKIN